MYLVNFLDLSDTIDFDARCAWLAQLETFAENNRIFITYNFDAE